MIRPLLTITAAIFALPLASPAHAQTPGYTGPVAVLVAIPIPAALPRANLPALYTQSIPQFQALPGLIRKYYTIGDDNSAGGIYLWKSRAAASAYYNAAWQAAVLKRWGKPASVSYYEVPVAIDGSNPGQ